MLQFVDCPLCENDDYTIMYESSVHKDSDLSARQMSVEHDAEHHRIVRCNRCRLQYSNPIDHPEILDKNYRQLDATEYLNQIEERTLTFKNNFKVIKKYKSEGCLLDIGCSVGLFLNAAKKDMDVYGVEVSEITSKYAREQFGLRVTTGEVYENFKEKFFEVVTLWDVIEHVPAPKSLLHEVYRILKDDGIICLATPCVDGLLAKVLGEKWIHYIRTHLTFFSTKTITDILHRTGFEIIAKTDYSRVFTVGYFVNRAKQFNPTIGLILCGLIKAFWLENVRISFNLKDTMFIIARKKK